MNNNIPINPYGKYFSIHGVPKKKNTIFINMNSVNENKRKDFINKLLKIRVNPNEDLIKEIVNTFKDCGLHTLNNQYFNETILETKTEIKEHLEFIESRDVWAKYAEDAVYEFPNEDVDKERYFAFKKIKTDFSLTDKELQYIIDSYNIFFDICEFHDNKFRRYERVNIGNEYEPKWVRKDKYIFNPSKYINKLTNLK